MTPEHQAAETALRVAMQKLEAAETYIRLWQWSFVALGLVAITGWIV